MAQNPDTTDTKSEEVPGSPKPKVFDLTFDPMTLFLTCSLPNIPPYQFTGDLSSPHQISRSDAINIHNQILSIYGDNDREKERKSRTTRGWWVAWSRMSGGKEAVLVWKGGEGNKEGGALGDAADGGSGGGLFDTKKYFEVFLRGRT